MFLLGDGIHLDHHAIDLVGQVLALGFPFGAERQHLFDVAAQFAADVDFETHTGELFERFPMAAEDRRPVHLEGVSVVIEAA